MLVSLREDVSQNHAALRLSALQLIYELVHFKSRHERVHGKCSSKVIADAYRAGITFAETCETVTDSFVDQAMTFDARMLSNDVVATILLDCDDKFGLQTPFNGTTKLQAIVSKARTPEKITWCVASIADMW